MTTTTRTRTRPVFTAHYAISVQRNDDCTADVPGHEEPIRIDGSRTPEADLAAARQAVAIANGLAVGEDGRVAFGGYTVFVNHVVAFGERELLAVVERRYSWDSSSDYTFAKSHCGNMPYGAVDALNPTDTLETLAAVE